MPVESKRIKQWLGFFLIPVLMVLQGRMILEELTSPFFSIVEFAGLIMGMSIWWILVAFLIFDFPILGKRTKPNRSRRETVAWIIFLTLLVGIPFMLIIVSS